MRDLALELIVLGSFLSIIILSWVFSEDMFNILDAAIGIFGWGY